MGDSFVLTFFVKNARLILYFSYSKEYEESFDGLVLLQIWENISIPNSSRVFADWGNVKLNFFINHKYLLICKNQN